MGEAKQKSQSRKSIFTKEPRCIYCSAPAETVEHMPPRAMFKDRQRPGLMEYGACGLCNNGTRGADAVAVVMALLHPGNSDGSWQTREIHKLVSTLDAQAPGVREEMSIPGKVGHEWARRPGSGLFQKVVRVHADGPRVNGYLSVFGAKLGMALYREHVGTALPLDGSVWCQFALNAGMTQRDLDDRVKILPIHETLRQGRKTVGDQFAYRYNCDGRTVVAAVVQFHRSLWFTIFASSDQRIISLFAQPDILKLPASSVVKPGGLLGLIPTPL